MKTNKTKTVNIIDCPYYPELYYRLTNEWKSWHHFLGPQSADSTSEDAIENEAFDMLKQHPQFTGKYDAITISLWCQLTESKYYTQKDIEDLAIKALQYEKDKE